MILRVVHKAVILGKTEDVRSDDDSDGDSDVEEEHEDSREQKEEGEVEDGGACNRMLGKDQAGLRHARTRSSSSSDGSVEFDSAEKGNHHRRRRPDDGETPLLAAHMGSGAPLQQK